MSNLFFTSIISVDMVARALNLGGKVLQRKVKCTAFKCSKTSSISNQRFIIVNCCGLYFVILPSGGSLLPCAGPSWEHS